MVRVFFLQVSKKEVNGALVFLVVLPGFTGIDKIKQRYEVFSSSMASYQMYPIRAE